MDSEELYKMIYKRKSFHLFRNIGIESLTKEEIDDIIKKYKSFIPIDSTIKTTIEILPEVKTNCHRGEEYCILLYSEKKDGYLRNIGYLGEQLDLYLVSKNIGSLWFGIGKVEKNELNSMDYVIMLAISKVSDINKFRKDMFKSKRKAIDEIWQGPLIEGVSDIIRFAPSACNTQPWIVKHIEDKLYIYRYKKPGKRGIMPVNKVLFYNQIDLGIFLCFLDLCLKQKKIEYSVEYFSDNKGTEEVLNAIYTLK